MFMYVGLFIHSAVVSCFFFFHVFMFYVGLQIVRLCFTSDIVLFFTNCCIDLFRLELLKSV